MKPKLDTFKKAVEKYGGNLTKVAKAFRVGRGTLYTWLADEEYKQAVDDIRGTLFDECLTTARVVALGIPDIGADGKMRGWIERPDPHMIRYILSTLGRKEGFGESLDITTNGKEVNGLFKVLDREDIDRFKDDFNKEY